MREHLQGHRLTNQRKIILEELQKVDTHPTADEVYEMVRKRLPKISLGTVYRNLEVLSSCGLALKLEMAGAQKRFDGNPTPHHHVRCIECGRVGDVRCKQKELPIQSLCPDSSFAILGHRIDFYGLCPQCSQSQDDGTE